MSKKITFIFFIFVFFFIAIICKAFYIQVVNRERLLAYSQSQVIKKEIIHPRRGNIYDRNGAPLAINVPAYDLFIMPQEEDMTADGIKKLVETIPELDYNDIRNKVITRNKFTWIARKVRLKSEQLESLKTIKGLNIDETVKRYYPNEELLSQAMGFVGTDNIGLSGLEYSLNEKLKGKKKEIKYYKDAKGRAIKHESREFEETNEDVYLSIEKDIQIILEQALKESIVKHKADLGGAAVLDADTGEILAIANYPTFNPNSFGNSKEKERKLSFVTDPFEPGSVFKLFTVASALSNSIVQPSSVFYCEKGKYTIGKHVIREADTVKKHEWLSVSDIIKYSSNIGTTKIAFDLGFDKLKETLTSFNIGMKTGIELPAESNGIFTKDDKVSKIRLSNVSFGQGIATTAIQILSAYGALANGGYYIKPTILRREIKPEKNEILTTKVFSELKDMLIEAVESGTGQRARIASFDIGGKTSTAQRASSTGGYEGYIPGFVGISYNSDKRYVVYVYVENPTEGGYYGNTVAVPVVKKIMEYILFKNANKNQIAEIKVDKVNQFEKNITPVNTPKIFKFKKGVMPNLEGLDRQSLEDFSIKNDFKMTIKGFGLVRSQYPKAGEKLNENASIIVELAPPSYD